MTMVESNSRLRSFRRILPTGVLSILAGAFIAACGSGSSSGIGDVPAGSTPGTHSPIWFPAITHEGGAATKLYIEEVFWGRLVIVYDINGNLRHRDYLIGEDINLPIAAWVDAPEEVGTDRLISAAAAYAVAENAVIIADFGTAVTIDIVDEKGVFQGGVILPGFDLCAQSLNDHTAKLPKVAVSRPAEPWGKNTQDAINAGLYYGAVGALQEIVQRYSEKLGSWPQTVITGSGAKVIYQDCEFIDSYVPHMVIKGIVLAYRKHLEAQR